MAFFVLFFLNLDIINPVEEYLNSPKDTAPNDLETNIHFAVK
jgi:hypothetical protein